VVIYLSIKYNRKIEGYIYLKVEKVKGRILGFGRKSREQVLVIRYELRVSQEG
jgi:hypothetical protein